MRNRASILLSKCSGNASQPFTSRSSSHSYRCRSHLPRHAVTTSGRLGRRSVSSSPALATLHSSAPAMRNHESDISAHADNLALSSQPSQSLQRLCAGLHERIASLLDLKTDNALLRSVQEQTRTSLRVAQDALNRYKWVYSRET